MAHANTVRRAARSYRRMSSLALEQAVGIWDLDLRGSRLPRGSLATRRLGRVGRRGRRVLALRGFGLGNVGRALDLERGGLGAGPRIGVDRVALAGLELDALLLDLVVLRARVDVLDGEIVGRALLPAAAHGD